MWRILILFGFELARSSAQELFVFSEMELLSQPGLSRLDCAAFVALGRSRETLSPVLRAGGNLTLVVVIHHAAGSPLLFRTDQSPQASISLKAYRFLPGLDPPEVALPTLARTAESQSCAVFLLDAQAPASTAQGRVKLEIAVWLSQSDLKNFWIRHPLEVRLLPPSQAQSNPCPKSGSRLEQILLRNWFQDSGTCLDFASLREKHSDWKHLRQNASRSQ